MFKENDCTKCPCYYYHQDYWGESDEYCMTRSYEKFQSGCHLPMFIRKIMQWQYDREMQKAAEQYEKDYQEEMDNWTEIEY